MGHQYRGTDLKHRDEIIMELVGPPNHLSDAKIGEIVGLSRVRVMQIRQKWIAKHISPLVDYYRTYMTDICERGIEALQHRVDEGDPSAAPALKVYMDRLAKLHGTDKQEEPDLSGAKIIKIWEGIVTKVSEPAEIESNNDHAVQ